MSAPSDRPHAGPQGEAKGPKLRPRAGPRDGHVTHSSKQEGAALLSTARATRSTRDFPFGLNMGNITHDHAA